MNDVRKIKRLQIWCNDVNVACLRLPAPLARQTGAVRPHRQAQSERQYIPLYVKREKWEKYLKDVKAFNDVVKLFKLQQIIWMITISLGSIKKPVLKERIKIKE